MGCDIHLFAEKKNGNGQWESVDKWSNNPEYGKYDWYEPEFEIKREDRFYTDGRNYNLFCALAGARMWEFLGDPIMVSPPKGFPEDGSQQVRKEFEDMAGDAHTASWLTLKELKDFDWTSYGTTCNAFREEVMPKMEAFGVPDTDVRIVFWFDN